MILRCVTTASTRRLQLANANAGRNAPQATRSPMMKSFSPDCDMPRPPLLA
jgi:hypothetical protein